MQEIWKPNTLLRAPNLIEKWKMYCDEKTIEAILFDFKLNGYNIDDVNEDLSYWDVSDYIAISSNVDIISKAKSIFSFVLSGNHVLMNGRKCYDPFTTLIGMKETGVFSVETMIELGTISAEIYLSNKIVKM